MYIPRELLYSLLRNRTFKRFVVITLFLGRGFRRSAAEEIVFGLQHLPLLKCFLPVGNKSLSLLLLLEAVECQNILPIYQVVL